ncbi:MAG: OpgC domain-containing protein [Rhodomicrobium sp.]
MNRASESAKVFRSRWLPILTPAGSYGAERAESGTPGRISPVEKPHYDYRIDFFRGLSLIFIFINHIPENAFTYLTSRTFTLFDSAEVFMFLAGYSAALGYYGLAPQGLQAFSRKALARARAIWTYHLVLVAVLMAAAFVLRDAWGVRTDYEIFLDRIESDPMRVLIGTPLLAFQAPLLDILPMYVVVMLLAPFLIWMRARSELALLAASGLVWMFAARFFPSIPTMTYDVAWFFNPFCWQFLFAIGLAFGWRARANLPPVAAGDGRRILDICCAAFVVFSAFVLMTIASHTIDDVGANRLRAMYFSLNKQCLDLWRVVGLLASAYLVARLVPKEALWLRLPLSRWVCAAGAASLPIFALTVVLSFAGKFFVQALGGTVAADGIATGVGVVVILGVALALKAGLFQALADRLFGPAAPRARAPQQ